jgi:hypothetical protein
MELEKELQELKVIRAKEEAEYQKELSKHNQ